MERLRVSACILVLAATCVAAGDLPAQSFRLASIQISGSNRLPADGVAAASGLSIGQPVTVDDLQSAADKLSELGLFDHVTYEYMTTSETLSVTFVVEETAKLRPCEFDNFVWLPKEELVARLQAEIPLFTGAAPPGGYLVEEIRRVLQKLLAERGVRARVTHLAPMSDAGGVNLFRVEGVSLPVAALQFRGAEKLGEGRLREASQPLLAQNFSRSFLYAFIGGTLIPFYRSRGYLRAAFRDPEVEYLGEAEGAHPVRVTLAVDERDPYRVREIRWVGNQVLSQTELEKRISLRPGDVADTVKLGEELRTIREEEYGGRGYILAWTEITPQPDDATLTADLNVHIAEGDLYRFRALVIQGLPERAADQLTRKWKLQPGAPFDTNYLRKFIKDDVEPVLRGLTPVARNMSYSLDRSDAQKTVTVVLRFR
jgi:outer membrane protein insertion porin family